MRSRAFTLLESLVIIAVISVLLALLTSAIRGTRDRARQAVSLANLRSHAQAFTAYLGDFRDTFPFFTTPWQSRTLTGGGVELEDAVFFEAHHTWHIVFAEMGYTGSVESKVFWPPRFLSEDGGGWPFFTPYNYPCVFITEPEYWNPYTRMGPIQYRATWASQVIFPAAKSLVVERWPYEARVASSGQMRHKLPVAFCDGAARTVRWNERAPEYEGADGIQFVPAGAVHFVSNPPLLHTIDGVRGRDVQ